jgi:hypothetical protein
MLAHTSLISIVMFTSYLALVATVLALVGVPMAGSAAAFGAAAVSMLFTIPIALVFSQGHVAESQPPPR